MLLALLAKAQLGLGVLVFVLWLGEIHGLLREATPFLEDTAHNVFDATPAKPTGARCAALDVMKNVTIDPLPRQTLTTIMGGRPEATSYPFANNHDTSKVTFHSALCSSLGVNATCHAPSGLTKLSGGILITRNAFLLENSLEAANNGID
jgi:hypothetical protein